MSFGQGYYEVKTLGTTYSEAEIQTAFNSADFCGSHYATQRFLITLDDGSEVELLAANEITGFSENCVLAETANLPDCTYAINAGTIIRKCAYPEVPKKELLMQTNTNN